MVVLRPAGIAAEVPSASGNEKPLAETVVESKVTVGKKILQRVMDKEQYVTQVLPREVLKWSL